MHSSIVERFRKSGSDLDQNLLIAAGKLSLLGLTKIGKRRAKATSIPDLLWTCGITPDSSIEGDVRIKDLKLCTSFSETSVTLTAKNTGILEGYSDCAGNPVKIREGIVPVINQPQTDLLSKKAISDLNNNRWIKSYVVLDENVEEGVPEIDYIKEALLSYSPGIARNPKILTIEIQEEE